MARGFNYAAGASAEIALASQVEMDKAQLAQLGQSKNAYVREIIAGRLDCPLGLMVTLAHDYVPDVRIAVARNPSALQSVMEYLARDKHTAVVEALMDTPALPAEVLGELAFHKRASVRDLAVARLNAANPAGASPEDHATPELRDRAFERPDAAADVPAFQPEPLDADQAHARAAAPTRTAPVRGFRIPEAT